MLLTYILTIGNWHPSIGDPTYMGWFTVFSYYLTSLICFFCSSSLVKQKIGKKARKDWLLLGLFILFLGICKEYNLPSALTEIGRIMARKEGWIKNRRIIQIIFLLIITPFLLFSIVKIIKNVKKMVSLSFKIALFFTIYLSIFVLLRTVSLHQWEEVLGYFLFGFIKINWLGELLGIYGIFFSGIINLFLPSSTTKKCQVTEM